MYSSCLLYCVFMLLFWRGFVKVFVADRATRNTGKFLLDTWAGIHNDSEYIFKLICRDIYHCHIFKYYKNERSLEICHWVRSSELLCDISRWCDQPFSRKWRLKLLFMVIFRKYRRPDVTLSRGTSCRVTVLVLFKRFTRGETQFWIELRFRTYMYSQIIMIIKSIPTTHCHLSLL